jgi:hypothetical protein
VTARRYRPGRYRLRRRNANAGPIAVVAVAVMAAASAGSHAIARHPAQEHSAAPGVTAAAAPVASGSETAFIAAVLADLGAPDTSADQQSMAAWGAREGCWGCVGQWNQWDTILPMPGSWPFNTFDGDLHVQNYPTASEGAQATALTLEDGYPLIVAALRSGAGICGGGFASELGRWSGDGYTEVC